MSDPRTYQIPTETEVDCESCSWTNTVDVWDDIRTGEWSYEFDCKSCGKHNTDHGSNLDRGAAHPLVLVFLAGFALVCVGLCILSTFLILSGFALMLPTPTIGVLAILNRKENDHV